MGFAVLLDLVSEVFNAPAFGFLNRAAIVRDNGLVGFEKTLELLRGNILAAEEYMFVERHEMSPFLVQIYGPAQSLFEPEVRKGSKIDPKERKQRKAQAFRSASSRGLMERTYTCLLALCNR
jgi:hypothetical protein